MAFKMKGYQAHSKSPMQKGGVWDTVKSKAKQAKDYISERLPSTANMSNIVGDPEFKAKMTRQIKAGEEKLKKQKVDQAYRQQKRDKMQAYKEEYRKGPGSKKRANETDEQFNRRYNDMKRHAQNYAEKKYAEHVKSESEKMGPKTQTQSIAERDVKKPVPFAKKKKY
tara:strand:+ start:7360 stop:7863 length:504 start_codon:yes stop_codon:yes gene_type:complete